MKGYRLLILNQASINLDVHMIYNNSKGMFMACLTEDGLSVVYGKYRTTKLLAFRSLFLKVRQMLKRRIKHIERYLEKNN